MHKVGIIGLGHVAAHQVAALEISEDFELVAACDTDPATFRSLNPGVATYTEIETFLSHSGVDVVVVATPNRLHATHGIAVMAEGKWLVMEKPLTETQADFDRIESARQENSGRCTLALHAAFGVEVAWLCAQKSVEGLDKVEISSIYAQFYDPYFEDGRIVPAAESLGGSWMDSGINALSVVGRLIGVADLKITDSRMSRVQDSGCLEIQGTVDFDFPCHSGSCRGSIDTNWTIGRNKKKTTLGFRNTDNKIVLDHSAQQVLLCSSDEEQTLFSCDNGNPRLTNHYIGVFRDVAAQIDAGQDNFDYCRDLHRIVFEAQSRMVG